MKTRTTKTEYAQAMDLLTRYLALRDHSRKELALKMGRRFATALVTQVIDDADRDGLIPCEDVIAERTARAFKNRLKSHGYVEAQLLKRALPIPTMDTEVELQNARTLIEKKFGEAAQLSYDDKSKAYRYMKYRGFDDRTIRMVLNGQDL